MAKLTAPKGTQDLFPEVTPMWQHIEQTFRDTVERYGYGEIRVPTFEATELFQRGVGDSTDVVQKEMYTFDDKGGRSMTLRPEGTAGIVRAFIEHGRASQPMPQRFYYAITSFRYENVQKGRLREFHQLGVEAFGAPGPAIDAELIVMMQRFFEALGLGDLELRINNIGTPETRSRYLEDLRVFLAPLRDDLCADCRARIERNPLRVIDCKNPTCQAVTVNAPLLTDQLDEQSHAHFEGLKALLDALGQEYIVDKRIVRGLDYYTDTVFEFVSANVGTQGTILGGGRYNGLVQELGGPDIPGLGCALGVERLLMELEARGLVPAEPARPDLIIVSMDADGRRAAMILADRLRSLGHAVESDSVGRSVKAQMKYAHKRGARFTMVLGEDELRSGAAKVHPMGEGQDLAVDFRKPEAVASALKLMVRAEKEREQ